MCFPRVRAGVIGDMDRFYDVLHGEHGEHVRRRGHWFDTDRHHFRLDFGWPPIDELRAGLDSLSTTASTVGA